MSDRTFMPYLSGTGRRGASTISDVRRSNEQLVLSLLRSDPGLSNAEMARHSGLVPQTVSVIVSHLSKAGLIRAGNAIRGKRGQPARPKFLKAEAAYGIGVKVGWHHADAVLADFEGRVLTRWQKAFDYPDPFSFPEELGAALEKIISSLDADQRTKVVGLGLAMPEGIWSHLYRVLDDKDVAMGWRELDLAAELSRRTGYKVRPYNDGTAACVAERIYGSGRTIGDFVNIFVSTYLGAGIVSGGYIFEGPTGNAANLGAMMAPGPQGGSMPVHNIAGLEALDEKRKAAGLPPLSQISSAEAWAGPELETWLEEAGAGLALIIANARAVVEYETAFIDGAIPAVVRRRLAAQVRRHLSRLPALHLGWPEVREGNIGEIAPALGAASEPLNERYFGESVLPY